MVLPTNLQCYIRDSYSVTIPSAKRYLGKKSAVVYLTTVDIEIFLNDAATQDDFWTFFETSINHGVDKFQMPLEIFGERKNYWVSISSISEKPSVSSSVVSFTANVYDIETR